VAGAELQIHLLGNFHLVHDGQPVSGLDSSRLQSFLTYLILHRGTPLQRQQLAFTFWPDSSESQARTNTRNTLFKLREAFPEVDNYLEISNQILMWNPESPLELDLDVFQKAADRTDITGAGKDPNAHLQALTAAVEAYPGDLLPSCYEDWIMPQRERLRQRYLRLLEELAETLEVEKSYDQALPYAQELVRQDPLLERSYQLLISIYLGQGDKARALQTYHQCVDTLEKELGIEPDQQTFNLYQRLLTRDQQVLEPIRVTEKSARLIGRDRSWETLQQVWNERTDQPHLVLIQGEAGIGKTYLGESFLRWIRRQGVNSLKTRSYPTAGELVYRPVADLLRNETICPKLSFLEEPWLIELSRLLPEIRKEHPNLPEPEQLDENWQRQRLFEAAVRAILRGEQRLVIMMDDLQWCDRETLAWLGYLLKFNSPTRLLILATIRSENLGARERLEELMGELQRLGKMTVIELSALNQESTQILARDTWGDDLDPETARHLYQETEGNPLFVVEIVRSGFLQTQSRETRTLPPKVQAVIETRLNALSEQTRELARIAAVFGRKFDYELLVKAAGVSEEQAVESLDELWGRRMIREEGEGGYNFSHDKFREVIYQTLSPPKRSFLHKKVALALEKLEQDALERSASLLAHHFYQAGEWDKTIDYYLLAGDQARKLYAGEDAIDYYRSGAELLGQPNDPRAIQIYQGWGNALLKMACYSEAAEAYQKMEEAARAANDCRCQVLAWLSIGKVRDRQGHHADTLQCAEKALQLAREHNCEVEKAEAVLLLGQSYHRLGKADLAEENIIQAMELSVKGKDSFTTGRCLSLLGLIKDDLGDYKMAQDYKEQALEIFENLEGTQAQEWIGTINNNLANTANLKGNYQRAVSLYEKAQDVFRRTKNQDMIIMCLVNQSAARIGLGQFLEAEKDLREVLQLTESSGWLGLSLTYCFLAEALLRQEKYQDALEAANKALKSAEETGAQQALGAAWRVLGKTASQLSGNIALDGDGLSARDCFQRSEEIFKEVNAEAERAHTLQTWAEHELENGDQKRGQELDSQARELFKRLGM
jgi:predicted ATPase/DNA-binding SARP family transcriptional activator